jgi:hypothetical protein
MYEGEVCEQAGWRLLLDKDDLDVSGQRHKTERGTVGGGGLRHG